MSIPDYKFEGFSQYRMPLSTELSGRSLHLKMDDAHGFDLHFVSSTIRWSADGLSEREDCYECLKVDDDVYFVSMEISGCTPRTGISLGIDFENMLVTCVISRHDETGPAAFFTKNEIVFGAIQKPDGTYEKKRHTFTNDNVGKAICWYYNPDFAIVHIYPTERQFSSVLAYYKDNRNLPVMRAISYDDKLKWSDGPMDTADWIKLKEGIYMFAFVESNYPDTLSFPKRNALVFAFNLKRVQNFGRLFGYNDNGHRESYTFSAYGQYLAMDATTE